MVSNDFPDYHSVMGQCIGSGTVPLRSLDRGTDRSDQCCPPDAAG